MSLATQRLFPGNLETAYLKQLERLTNLRAVEKIWTKQASFWKAEESHARVIANRLGWIDVLGPMRAEAGALRTFAREMRDAGFRDVVLLGMGGSSLAPEVFSLVFPPAQPGRFFVLDSTDPASVLAIERNCDLRHTLFIVASKSGKTIETLSQFHYFCERVRAAGIEPAGRSFIAITDAGSHLDQLAAQHSFRHTFRNPADIGGRYSALSYFGLVPAALWGVNLDTVLADAIEMREACGPAAKPESNPALALGALMGASALEGVDKLALVATPALASLGNWIEQLVAESTGKEGKGIAPAAGEAPGAAEVFSEDCMLVVLALEGEERRAIDSLIGEFTARGRTVAEICFSRREQLGAEFFRWEVATSVAGAVLGINPFDEPNVQESKDNTSRLLADFERSRRMPLGTRRLAESGIEIYAEGPVSQQIPFSSLTECLGAFLHRRRTGDYLALLAYVDRSAANAQRLEALRLFLRDRLGMPVLLGFGPRYLHSIGQFYKGGPKTGMFLVITAAVAEDAPIPNAGYTFAQLETAQALGDLAALELREKPALRLHFTQGVEAGLSRLENALQGATK